MRRFSEALDRLRDMTGIGDAVPGGGSFEEYLKAFAKGNSYASVRKCAAEILSDETLFDAFLRGTIVPQTWFFRQPAQYDFLREYFLKMPVPAGEKFRVLCAPCSTGQEAYSAAAVLLDCGASGEDFVVDGADICRDFIRAARRGEYSKDSMRSLPPKDIARFFPVSGGCLRVCGELKACVSFFKANLAEKNAPLPNAPYNLIFCRNLAIYFSDSARRRLFDTLLGALAEDGAILSGYAEDFPFMDGRFESVGEYGCFACARRGEGALINERLYGKPRSGGMEKNGKAALPPQTPAARKRAWKNTPRLKRARALADSGKLDEAMRLCMADIEFMPTAENLFLAGDINLAFSNFGRAAEYFKRSAALDEGEGSAYFKLHLTYARLGRKNEADLYLEKYRGNIHFQDGDSL